MPNLATNPPAPTASLAHRPRLLLAGTSSATPNAMPQTFEEIQKMSHGAVCAILAELAPQVRAARAHYDELVATQRRYVAARDLNQAGLRLGDRVQLRGQWGRQKNPQAVVVEPLGCYLQFQLPNGELVTEMMFEGYKKI